MFDLIDLVDGLSLYTSTDVIQVLAPYVAPETVTTVIDERGRI